MRWSFEMGSDRRRETGDGGPATGNGGRAMATLRGRRGVIPISRRQSPVSHVLLLRPSRSPEGSS
jgi:hypothetical protein